MDGLPYELQNLAGAVRYQEWVARSVTPFLGKRILEFGSGIGTLSRWLPEGEALILSEFDSGLFNVLAQESRKRDPSGKRIQCFNLPVNDELVAIAKEAQIDTVVSFNVLEHISEHEAVLDRLIEVLRASSTPGPKRLITFVPAHGWLYGELDRAFGHCRRYERKSLEALLKRLAPEMRIQSRYFNLPGVPGWYLMGRVLKRSTLGKGSVQAFEKLVPLISGIDDFIHATLKLPVGQSLLSVATLPG